jgi:hypothetical protein
MLSRYREQAYFHRYTACTAHPSLIRGRAQPAYTRAQHVQPSQHGMLVRACCAMRRSFVLVQYSPPLSANAFTGREEQQQQPHAHWTKQHHVDLPAPPLKWSPLAVLLWSAFPPNNLASTQHEHAQACGTPPMRSPSTSDSPTPAPTASLHKRPDTRLMIACDSCARALPDLAKHAVRPRTDPVWLHQGMPACCVAAPHGPHCTCAAAKPQCDVCTGPTASTAQPACLSCHACSMTFGSMERMLIHAHQHTGTKPFACTQCPSAFMRAERLAKHMAFFHADHHP